MQELFPGLTNTAGNSVIDELYNKITGTAMGAIDQTLAAEYDVIRDEVNADPLTRTKAAFAKFADGGATSSPTADKLGTAAGNLLLNSGLLTDSMISQLVDRIAVAAGVGQDAVTSRILGKFGIQLSQFAVSGRPAVQFVDSIRKAYYWNEDRGQNQAFSLSALNEFTLTHDQMVVPDDARSLHLAWKAIASGATMNPGAKIVVSFLPLDGRPPLSLSPITVALNPNGAGSDGYMEARVQVPAEWKNVAGKLRISISDASLSPGLLEVRVDDVRFERTSTPLLADAIANNPAEAITLAEVDELALAARNQWIAAGAKANVLNGIQFSVADLPDSAVGQTQDLRITIDADAAGHGWFVDPTPSLGEEFSLAGSAAVGRMDLLTVLMHEMGHVLGFEHSDDASVPPGSLMSESLEAGTRRLPIALPAQAAATDVAGPQGIVLPALASDTVIVMPAPIYPMQPLFETASHTGIFNGDFGIANPTDAQFGWTERGAVSLNGGFADLSEDNRLMSELTQTFVKPDGIVGMRFTLRGAQFGVDGSAPPDAFELAILDALTGQSVAGTAPLTHTDSLLNIQSNGSVFAASGVKVRGVPINGSLLSFDQPIRITVDLTGVAAGTSLKLYFDLLGFGARNSHVSIDDVQLLTRFNTEPLAFDDQVTTAEDNSVAIPVLANDQDPDGDALTAMLVASPLHGTLVNNANGSFSYTPNANFFGTDTFTYKANDGEFDSNVATVTITVTPVNDAPVAADAQATTPEDTALTLDLRTFATDVDSSVLTAAIVTGPAHGVLTANANGTFTYTPALNFFGPDSFTYKVNDGELNSNVATMTLTVTAVNDAPVAANAQASTFEDNALVLDLRTFATDVDSSVLSALVVTSPAHGVLTQNANGTFTYTPNANFNGSDSLTYKVNDGALDSNVATVAITVVAVNDAPRGTSKTVTTAEDTPYVFTLADFGFSDPSDTPANNFTAVTVSTLPLAGSLQRNGVAVTAGQSVTAADITAGLLRFAPALNANGTAYASFGFRVQDDGGTANGGVDRDPTERTITGNVTAVNDAPVAANAQASTLEDNALVLDLRTFATDVDGDALTALVVAGPAHGVLTANANGTFTYTPNANFNGSDSFTYKVNDGALDSNVATVAITIVSVNDAPVASDASLTTKNNATLLVDPRTFATDVDSTVLTTQSVTGPTHGTLAPNADGTYTYTPTAGFVGADSFRCRVSDGQLTSSQADVNISVTASNSAPVAVSSSIAGVEDTPYVFAWADFHVTDADSTTLSIVVGSLPASA